MSRLGTEGTGEEGGAGRCYSRNEILELGKPKAEGMTGT